MINEFKMKILDTLENYFLLTTQATFLKGLSLTRIGLGIIILYNYLIVYFQRHFLFGPNGVVGDENIGYSLYNLMSEQWYFELIYHFGIVFAILFTIGYKGRVVSIINYIFVFSFIRQGFLVSDGGDNLLYLILFYLLFANTTAYFSFDSMKKNMVNTESLKYKMDNLLTNFAVYACVIQICIVYFISALYQVHGEMWFNGTALYYILQTDIFSNAGLANLIINNEVLIVAFGYGSILIKLAFPFLLFNKTTKYFAIFFVVTFHVGIAVFMGLITFAATMIVVELLLLTDKEYRKLTSIFSSITFKNRRENIYEQKSNSIL